MARAFILSEIARGAKLCGSVLPLPEISERDIAAILREHLGSRAARVSTRRMPTPVLKALAVAVPSLRPLAHDAGQRRHRQREHSLPATPKMPKPRCC